MVTLNDWYELENLPGVSFKPVQSGLWIRQDGAQYVARLWTLSPDVVEVICKAAEYGFSCLIRHSHPRQANQDEKGVEYIGFSRTPNERWVFVLDQFSSPSKPMRDRVTRVVFEKNYEGTLKRAHVRYDYQPSTARNLFVDFDQFVFALQACAEEAEAVEIGLGSRDWELKKATIGFVAESTLESFLVANWTVIPELASFKYYQRQMRAAGGFLDIICCTTDDQEVIVIELKRGRVGEEVVKQLDRYMESEEVRKLAGGRAIRGIAISRDYYPSASDAAAQSSFPVELWTFEGDSNKISLFATS